MSHYHYKNYPFKLIVLIYGMIQLVNTITSPSMLTTKHVQFIKSDSDTDISSHSSLPQVTNKGIARPVHNNHNNKEMEMIIKSPQKQEAKSFATTTAPETHTVIQSAQTSFLEPILVPPTFTPHPSSEVPVSISLFGEIIRPQPNQKPTEKTIINEGNEDEEIEIEIDTQPQVNLMDKTYTMYIIFAIALCVLVLHYILLRLNVNKLNSATSARLKVV